MLYRIESILHSGTKGERNTPRIDGRYPLRVGRIVDMEVYDVAPGYPMFIDYVKDENGNDYTGMLVTSLVKDIYPATEELFTVETNNSIWTFRKVDSNETDI